MRIPRGLPGSYAWVLPWCSHGAAVELSWCFDGNFHAPIEGLPWCFHGDLRASGVLPWRCRGMLPWCFRGASGDFHGASHGDLRASVVLPSMMLPRCFHTDLHDGASPMHPWGLLWCFHGILMVFLWCLCVTITIRVVLRSGFLEARCFHGPWCFDRVLLLYFHGPLMVVSRYFHGASTIDSMVFPWDFRGRVMVLRGASLVLPWRLRLP